LASIDLTFLTTLDLIILALACWRLSYLLTKEKAPFGVMTRIRERTTLGGLLSCLFCASIWSAVIMTLLYLTPLRPVVVVFAVSGLALMAASYTGVGGQYGGTD
jgi:hypothetical protein